MASSSAPQQVTGFYGDTYGLVWSDEFGYTGAPDPAKWTYQVGGHGWGNNELEYYTDGGHNAQVADGVLSITARHEAMGEREYTSARIATRGRASWLYGFVDVRAKLPRGLGTWPAIWMIPEESVYGGWPKSGEIDIMEHVGFDQDVIVGSVHTEAFNHRIGTQKNNTVRVPGVSDDFHNYQLEWRPDGITLAVDGKPYFRYDPKEHVSEVSSKEWPFDRPFHLILNVAFGGDWGGAQGVDASVLPQAMAVEYARVYQK